MIYLERRREFFFPSSRFLIGAEGGFGSELGRRVVTVGALLPVVCSDWFWGQKKTSSFLAKRSLL